MARPLIANGTVYKTLYFDVQEARWHITQATGHFNYVSIVQVTDNPNRTDAMDFKTWDLAITHYAGQEIEAILLQMKATLEKLI